MILRRSAGLRNKDIGEGRDSPGQPWACHPVFLLASWTPALEPRALLTDKAKKTYSFLFQMGRRSTDTFLGSLSSAATNCVLLISPSPVP